MDFSARLSQIRHDLRTPVGHIIGYSEMLQEDLGGGMEARTSDDLYRIKQAGERLLNLIDEHLGTDKKSLDQIDLKTAEFQLRGQLDQVLGYCDILRDIGEDSKLEAVDADLQKIELAARNFTEMLAGIGSKLASPAIEETQDKISEDDSESQAKLETLIVEVGGSLLVVDDDPVNRDILTRRLEPHGYVITQAESGKQALELMESEVFELVLLDYSMPGMSGLEVLNALKKHPDLRIVPVIMLSASDDTNKVVECILRGAEDYIFKPFNPVLLRARVAACLEKHRLRRRTATRLTVFVSSPGDVIPERQAVKRAIAFLNNEFDGKANIVPILWEEEPLVASDTFQSQIISPRETDFYIGIFWSRMGTPLPSHITREDGSTYGSGSEFEFEDAMAGSVENQKPDILVYQKTADIQILLTNRSEIMEAIDQKERLDTFISKSFKSADGDSYVGAFHVFPSVDHFEELVLGHLRKLVVKRLAYEGLE